MLIVRYKKVTSMFVTFPNNF